MQQDPARQKPFQLIDRPADLPAAVAALRSHDTLAFDLEFDSHRNAYGVTLCLIQVAAPDACYIIDPLAGLDLGGLYTVFEDAAIQKIVHSPGEDLRLLHSLGCFPQNVFDTEVVAKLLNYEQTSLAAMLEAKTGFIMNKGQQRSNWIRRPLTPEQLRYAAADVTSLHALKAALAAEAEPAGLMPFVLEEQAALSTTIHQPEEKTSFLKPADLYAMSPYDQHVLNALFFYRDELARKRSKPAYQIMDETLVRALAAGEMDAYDLPSAKGIWGGYKNTRFADEVAERLEALHDEAGRLALSTEIPRRPRQTGDSRAARAQAEADKEEKFAPIQSAMAVRYGAHAARFMLSNGAVNEILKQHTFIGQIKRAYRQEIIRGIAGELGIDLSGYE